MPPSCINHSEIPHTTRIFRDLIYHFDRVSSFYRYGPLDMDSYRKAAREIELPAERRAALVAALRAQNGDSPLLDQLARPDTVAVVTGQQVGLFGGPAYSIYKALTAVRLARKLTEEGTPAVPLFWLATEDHDFAEVNHCWFYDSRQQPVRLEINGHAGDLRPVGNISFSEYPIAAIRELLGDFPFAEEVVQQVASAYAEGRTLGQAFQQLMRSVLGSYELLYIDPLHPAIRQLAAPLLRQAVEKSPALTTRLLERNKELEAREYHAQVHVESSTALFFLLDGEQRINLKRQNGEFVAAKDRRFSTADLANQAEFLSPNALLRPVVQDYMIPTVAYIGGPAELAYFAQSQVLYEELLGRMPVVVSRSGFSLLDAPAQKRVAHYHLSVPQVFTGVDQLRETMAARLIPSGLEERFAAARQTVSHELDLLREQVLQFDPTLAAAVEKSHAKVLYQLDKNQRKTAREQMRRSERAQADAEGLHSFLYPNKHLQERLYSILPFLAQHGPELVDRLYENVHLDCPDHIVLPL